MKNRALKQMLGGAFCLLSATVFAKGDGMIPFLAITGKPTEAEVRAKVATIAEQGIESFLVYARSGLELEYMAALDRVVLRRGREARHEGLAV